MSESGTRPVIGQPSKTMLRAQLSVFWRPGTAMNSGCKERVRASSR